jgi:hypothetical protein
MRKLVVTVALLAASPACAHAARPGHHESKRPTHQAVHAERHVVHKAKDAAPAMTLPYDAFRA